MSRPETDAKAFEHLAAACDDYERALRENDLQRLDDLFLESPETMRYGIGENLYGIDEIRRFRQARTNGSPARIVLRREIVLLGPEAGVSHLEFRYEESGKNGRQSQVWTCVKGEWRVIAAHVSLLS